MSWPARFAAAPAGTDKVRPLDEAVRSAVRPGQCLHFAFTHNRPAAAMAELCRQHRGQRPGFTMLSLFTAGPALALLSEGLVRELVTALVLEPYPAPAPSPTARRAVSEHDIALVHHSVLSYVAMLEAGARGLPGLPVRGLAGSSLAEGPDRRPREDGLVEVAARRPDLSFVHAPCADAHGNVLLSPPYGEGVWGALAAREGAVVTVERLVTPEVLRRHAHLPGLPASQVRSVSVVPFGAHPAGLAAGGIEGVEPYGDDVAHYRGSRQAGRTPQGWSDWVARWITGPRDQDEVLARLGSQRLLWLQGKARPDSWRSELLDALTGVDLALPPTPTERQVLAAAALIADKVEGAGHQAVLSGLGACNLAAWVAHRSLAARGVPLMLVAELGLAGYSPRPCDPYLFNFRNLATCTQAGSASTALGLFVGGAAARCLGSLGAGQVDGQGRFNSTQLADGTLLVGSGGANDVASTAAEVVLTVPSGRQRLVDHLPYVTGPGERVTALVTELGLFEKAPGREPLRLTRLVGPGSDPSEQVAALRARCGFPFEVSPELAWVAEPPAEEVSRLRLLDPERAFLGPEG